MPLAAPADSVIPALSLIDNPGHIEQRINGVSTRDPDYGLKTVWIEPCQREEAQALGEYDRSTQDPAKH